MPESRLYTRRRTARYSRRGNATMASRPCSLEEPFWDGHDAPRAEDSSRGLASDLWELGNEAPANVHAAARSAWPVARQHHEADGARRTRDGGSGWASRSR